MSWYELLVRQYEVSELFVTVFSELFVALFAELFVTLAIVIGVRIAGGDTVWCSEY